MINASTQTVEEYISIYDKPKKKLGKPQGTRKFTDEGK
jgi:hypothetical protein